MQGGIRGIWRSPGRQSSEQGLRNATLSWSWICKTKVLLVFGGSVSLGEPAGGDRALPKGGRSLRSAEGKWSLLSVVPASVILGSVTRGAQGPGRLWFQRPPVQDPQQ